MSEKASDGWRTFDDVDRRMDMDEAAGRRYEGACVEALRQYIHARSSAIRAMGREQPEVGLHRERPDAKIVVRYQQRGKGEQRLETPPWVGARSVENGAPAELLDHPREEQTRAFLAKVLR